jgi:hypothetical protein
MLIGGAHRNFGSLERMDLLLIYSYCSIAVSDVLLRASRWPTAQAGTDRAPGSGPVVTWRRAQMGLLSAQGTDAAAIARVAFTSEDRVRLRMPRASRAVQ